MLLSAFLMCTDGCFTCDQVGHVKRVPPCTLKFDFLVRAARGMACVLVVSDDVPPQGKDSIRYLQEHEVMPEVYEAIGQFAIGAPLGLVATCHADAC